MERSEWAVCPPLAPLALTPVVCATKSGGCTVVRCKDGVSRREAKWRMDGWSSRKRTHERGAAHVTVHFDLELDVHNLSMQSITWTSWHDFVMLSAINIVENASACAHTDNRLHVSAAVFTSADCLYCSSVQLA